MGSPLFLPILAVLFFTALSFYRSLTIIGDSVAHQHFQSLCQPRYWKSVMDRKDGVHSNGYIEHLTCTQFSNISFHFYGRFSNLTDLSSFLGELEYDRICVLNTGLHYSLRDLIKLPQHLTAIG